MTRLQSLHDCLARLPEALVTPLLPTPARLVFALVLPMCFRNSVRTKLGPGLFGWLFPADVASVQTFPPAMEAVGHDSSQLGAWHWLVAVPGIWAEFLPPVLILPGLPTRLAAPGMTGFIPEHSHPTSWRKGRHRAAGLMRRRMQ